MEKTWKILEFIIDKAIYPLVAAVLMSIMLIAAYFTAHFEEVRMITAAFVMDGIAIMWSLAAFACVIIGRFLPDEETNN